METRQLKVLVDADNALLASICQKEREKPKAKQEKVAPVVKPKRAGSKAWCYTNTGRYIGSDQ
jgi:hypothetical protein